MSELTLQQVSYCYALGGIKGIFSARKLYAIVGSLGAARARF